MPPSSLLAKLALPPDSRVAILHADDVGMCHAHNVGFFDVAEAGLVQCGSVMVTTGWFPEVAAWARRHPEVDLGVHLCLNSECAAYRWEPLLSRDRVGSLVDGDGYFWPAPAETLQRADPEEVRLELRAQIERALASGIDVTHIDAHLGTAMMQQLFAVYLDLGIEFRVPIFLPRPTRRLLEDVGRAEMIDHLDEILDGYDASHLVMVDHVELRSLCFEPERATDHYRQVIGELEPGVTHVLVHPARGDGELEAVTPDSWRQREAERRFFCAPEARRYFADAGIRVIGYRALRDKMRQP